MKAIDKAVLGMVVRSPVRHVPPYFATSFFEAAQGAFRPTGALKEHSVAALEQNQAATSRDAKRT
jgi:hypothetical protein